MLIVDAVYWWALILCFLVLIKLSQKETEPHRDIVNAAARLGYMAGMTGMTEEELMKEIDKAYED